MPTFPLPASEPLRVVVAGGGVAGLETLVALRALGDDRVAPVLVAPEETFAIRALGVFEPFGLGRSHEEPLAELTADLRVPWRRDAVARVHRARRAVTLRSGVTLPYDVLVLAVGALPYPAFDRGVCFDRTREGDQFDALLADARAGLARHVAVVVPRGAGRPLPGYELGLLLAAFGRPHGLRVTVVTAEDEPLAAFGPAAGELVRSELAAAGAGLVCGAEPNVPTDTVVELGGGRRLTADRVVHVPLLAGPRIAGVPYDSTGFVAVDDDLHAAGDPDVYAVGDGTTNPITHGGLAAEQAAAAAERIAWRAGADHCPRPYAPALRALLRTEHGPRYLRAEPPGGAGDCVVSDKPLWWPPSKVASRWLTPWLATRELSGRPLPPPRVLPSGGISRGSLTAS
jgi:sulfide:quinone oxidoreductase